MGALRHIYTALIRSALDYACIAYGSAAKSHLQKLNVVQAQALRLCCGAFKTSSVPALQVEVGEMPLPLRRLQLSMNYWVTLQGHTHDHPSKGVLNKCWEHGRKDFNSFGWVGDKEAERLDLNKLSYCPTVALSATPPWFFPMPKVDLDIARQSKKSKEYGGLSNMVQHYLSTRYYDRVQVYTDGSKDPDTGRTGAAVYVPDADASLKQRTPDNLAIYSVELLAILMALTWAEDLRPNEYVLCSDSMAALVSIMNFKSACRPDLICEIFQCLYRLSHRGICFCFLWVPAHTGVEGNEVADILAKNALKMELGNLVVPLSREEVKSLIKTKVCKLWQEQWVANTKGRFLFKIQPQVPTRRPDSRDRRADTVTTRLRIGHTQLNHSLSIIGKHATGQCPFCNHRETVEHVLLECPAYSCEREILMQNVRPIGMTRLTLEGLLAFSNRPSAWAPLMRFLKSTQLFDRI